ncbi:MAG: ABC transporter ATP-binding protein [Eubacterium sp.]|nr:ABC transporter ATP-binding protein [Eubacterium sp.]
MVKKLMNRFALTEQGAKDFIQAVIACTLADLALMLPVGLLYYMVGDLLGGTLRKERVLFYGAGILVAFLVIYATQLWKYNATFFLTYKESTARRITLAETLRRLPLAFFGKKDLSDLTNTLLGDCTAIEHSFSHEVPQFYGSVFSTVLIAVSLFFFDVRMALAALWVLPISLLTVGLSKKAQMRFNDRKTKTKVALEDGLQEYIEASKDLKSNNAENSYLAGFLKTADRYEKESMRAELGVAAYVVPAQLLLKVGIATTALVGAALLVQGSLSLLTFFMFLLVVSRLYEPMSGTLIYLGSMNAVQVNIDRTKEMNGVEKQTGTSDFQPEGCDIVFDHVAFAYQNGEQVLEDVSFTAKQGEVTALVGPSGGGKTTVSRLAARFWDATSGKITVGGVNVSAVDPEALLRQFSIVFQDVTLFDNSIMENIRVGRRDATDEEVLAAAKLANVDEFAARLPQGYQTPIGENGALLSGGERQRISIARAFLKDAPIILLDEATASLDTENETLIQTALSRLIKDKTVLIIAHRMRTVAAADKIVVIKDGRAEEQGTPQELAAQDGTFAKMLRLQQAL